MQNILALMDDAKKILQKSATSASVDNFHLCHEYDPEDSKATEYLKEQIRLFNESAMQLTRDYHLLQWLVPAELFFYLFQFGNLALITTALAAIYGGLGYKSHVDTFDQQLEKLIQLYSWCENNRGSKATFDRNFLNILEAIIGYVYHPEQLILFQQDALNDVSADFVRIMAQRNIILLMPALEKNNRYFNFFNSTPHLSKNVIRLLPKQYAINRFFSRCTEELKFLLHGRDVELGVKKNL